jgi:hypothetical protein
MNKFGYFPNLISTIMVPLESNMGFRFQHVPTAGSMGDEPTKHGDSLAMGYDMI